MAGDHGSGFLEGLHLQLVPKGRGEYLRHLQGVLESVAGKIDPGEFGEEEWRDEDEEQDGGILGQIRSL